MNSNVGRNKRNSQNTQSKLFFLLSVGSFHIVITNKLYCNFYLLFCVTFSVCVFVHFITKQFLFVMLVLAT